MSIQTCPSCNTSVPPGAVFCDNCGYDLRSVDATQGAQAPVAPTQVSESDGDIACPTCGHNNIAGSAFCENCGAQLPQAQPAPSVPPASPPQTPPQAPQAPAYQPPPEPAYEPPQQPEYVSPPPSDFVTGSLVIQVSNTTIPIPQGKQQVLIGREDPVSGIFPDIDLDQYGGQDAGVGRKHAQLILQGGQIYIEDLDSINGTVVNKQKISPRQPHPIKDGDELRFGKMALIYHVN